MALGPELPDIQAIVPDLGGLEFHDAKLMAFKEGFFGFSLILTTTL
jgi:hypothetical protein